jgi:putative membrane protein
MLGFGMFGLLIMLLFWGGLIALGVWLVGTMFPRDGRRPTSPAARDLSARRILGRRYAQGEITREQYDVTKQDLW